MGGGNLQPKIMEIKQATKRGSIEVCEYGAFDMSYPESKTRRGRVQENGNVSPTLTAQNQEIGVVLPKCRIRKLTPRECWRLMGFSDDDFDRAKSVNSDSQLYKQAGNSIVVPVLEEIFRRML